MFSHSIFKKLTIPAQTKMNEETEERNVFKLVSQLQNEKLFIVNEKHSIQKLNTSVSNRFFSNIILSLYFSTQIKHKVDNLTKSTWIATNQRIHLLNQWDAISENYQKIKSLMNPEFTKAKNVLGFPLSIKVDSLLHTIRTQPETLARLLIVGENLTDDNLFYILQSIVTGLYGSCLFPEDTNYMLSLLYELAKIQLLKSDNSRKILKLNSSFRNLYLMFSEVVLSAKYFLSEALEVPILRLLSWEFYLDIDPEKTLMR